MGQRAEGTTRTSIDIREEALRLPRLEYENVFRATGRMNVSLSMDCEFADRLAAATRTTSDSFAYAEDHVLRDAQRVDMLA
jgi:hypothetical protein